MDKPLEQLLKDRDELERYRNSGDPIYFYGEMIAWAALDKEADRLDRLIAELAKETSD